jgi:hypothetical protein
MTDPYGPPADQQPIYPPPAYPPPGYGEQPAPPAVVYETTPGWTPPPGYAAAPWGPPAPPPHRNRLAVWLVPALVAAVLIGAGIAYAVTGGGSRTKDTSSPPIAPASASPSSTASTLFTLPDSVDGVPVSPNSMAADQMARMMSAAMPGAKTVAGAYLDPTNPKRIIVLMGIDAPIADPAAEVKGGFLGLGITAQDLSKPKSYPPGPQGGVMQCASGHVKYPNVGQIPIAVCIVADAKGMILAMYYSTTQAHAVAVTSALRPEFETG